MDTRESFLAEIETFLTSAGMSASGFGTAALNDPSFVSELRQGREPSLRVVGKCRRFMGQVTAPQATAPGNLTQPTTLRDHVEEIAELAETTKPLLRDAQA